MAILTLTVDGDGTDTSGWQAEGGNYTRVQSDDGDASRLYSPISGQVRQFSLSNTSGLSSATINSVKVYASYRSLDPVSNIFQLGIRTGGTDYWSTDKDTVNSTTYGLYSHTWTTNPATGLAWTSAQLDALEIGIKKINQAGGAVSYMYAEVDYSESSGQVETGTGALFAGGTISGSGKPGVAASLSISGAGTASGSGSMGSQQGSGSGAISGDGGIAASGKPAFAASVALSGVGTATGGGNSGLQVSSGSGELSGAGSISVTRTPAFIKSVTIDGVGSTSASSAGGGVYSANTNITGTGSISGSGKPSTSGSGTISGNGSLSGGSDDDAIARDFITLATIKDVQSFQTYYLLATSAPSKPTLNPPGGSWLTSEPTYTAGSNSSLYSTELVTFSDGTFAYSNVQKSSSYEAAKVAYQEAIKALGLAGDALNTALSGNLLDNPGFEIGDQAGWTGWKANVVRDTSIKRTGVASLRIDSNGQINDASSAKGVDSPDGVPETLVFEFWMRATPGPVTSGTVGLSTTCVNSSGTTSWPAPSGTQVDISEVNETWVRYSGVLSVPANVVKVYTRLTVRNDVATGASVWFDDVIVRRVDAIANSTATTALLSANGKNSIIRSTADATGTINPQTGLPLIKGDTWEKFDSESTRRVIATWYWDGTNWRATLIKSEMIHNLDVSRLTADVASISLAVAERIVADLGYYQVLTTDHLFAGEADVDSLVAQKFATALADIITARIENLTVTEGANINSLVVQKIATEVINSGEFKTLISETTGMYAKMDSGGFHLIDSDGFNNESDPETLIRLGPGTENLFQLGVGSDIAVIDYAGNISGKSGNFQSLSVNGNPIDGTISREVPRGVVSWGQLFGNNSRALQGRDQVIGLEAHLAPGRVYRLRTSSFMVQTNNNNTIPFLQLHYTLDGTYPGNNWGNTAYSESIIGPYGGFRSMPPMEVFIDRRNRPLDEAPTFLRAGVSLADFANVGTCYVAANVHRAIIMVEDLGTNFANRGTPYYQSTGSGGAPVGLQPIRVRQVQRWYPTGWSNYIRGGGRDYGASSPTQGQYSSWNRECIFLFDSMTAALSGATIHRITLHARFNHWYNGAGGTGRWHWHPHFGGFPTSANIADKFMVDTGGWGRGTSREINLIPSEFGAWQSGARRGFGFSTSSTNLEYYGYLSTNMNDHWVEIDYEK